MTNEEDFIELEGTSFDIGEKDFTTMECAQISIALSLKRIADAIEGNPQRLGLVDGIMNAIEQGILGAQR